MSKHTSFPPAGPKTVLPAPGDQSLPGLILEQVRDAIILQDIRGRIQWINPACEQMFGWSLEELQGRHPHSFLLPPEARPSPAEIAAFRYRLGTSLFSGVRVSQHLRRDGSAFWNQQSYGVLRTDTPGEEPKIVVICRDLTNAVDTDRALQRVREELEHTALHDELTGLANRKRLNSYLGSEPVRGQVARGALGMLHLDIDKFKEINDTLGHAAGDATLVHVADALRQFSGPHDLPCRTGGDEFLLICFDVPGEAALLKRAEALLQQIGVPFSWSTEEIRVGSSIGASLPVDATTTGEAMIQMADQALYVAKGQGRGCAVMYTEALGRAHKAQIQLVQDLHRAIEEEQFIVHLQPQLDLAQDRIVGCEALLRWNHPERGLLAPMDFLQVARRNGLSAKLDYQSMTMALDALVQLRATGHTDFQLSLNVSCATLADANYPSLLDWALQSRGIAPGDICIELLETTLLDRTGGGGFSAINRLKSLGVRVALDDFGTGYAGLAHMSSVDVDALKLDRMMISRLEQDPRSRMVVRAALRLGHLLGIEMVAEGVETDAQLEILRRAGCPLVQGFGIAPPMCIDDLTLWLEDQAGTDIGETDWGALRSLTSA